MGDNILQDLIDGECFLRLSRKTCQILETKQLELSQVRWTDGESNPDTEFSKLAGECCEEAWLQIREGEAIHIDLKCSIPDIMCAFTTDNYTLSK